MSSATVIVHGWSDCSESFVDIKKFLAKNGVGPVAEIYYADYESREDHLTFDDVVDGLNDEFYRRGFIARNGKKKRDLNVVVHSTGGLVIRHWIHQHYVRGGRRLEDCPIRRLVMLAPANFGSPLAHRGKSFLGSLVKGRWKVGDLLEVGRELLGGLELASPYQWALAHKDLLLDAPYYNADEIQLTILVGAEDYDGVRGWVNKPGTDGTVVIAGTSLDSVKLQLDFTKGDADDYRPFAWSVTQPVTDFGFGVIEGVDHGTIVAQAGTRGTAVGELLLRALKVRRATEFRKLCTDLDELTAQTYAHTGKDRYQQFILHAVDEYGASIPDFTVEFFIAASRKQRDDSTVKGQPTKVESRLSERLNAIMLGEIHTHSNDPSYRRLLVNLREITQHLHDAEQALGQPVVLSMRLYVPDRDRGIRYDIKNLQNVVLYDPAANTDEALPTLFYENTTTLVEMCVNRICDYVSVGTAPQSSGRRRWDR